MDDTGNPTRDRVFPSRDELLVVLSEAIEEIFASMFIEIGKVALAPRAEQEGTSDLEVSVGFRGAIEGVVRLRCCCRGAEDIARGMLMLDESEELPLEDVKDAFGECANMVTGSVKSKALDPVADFQMGVPEIRDAELPRPVEDASLVYRLSRGRLSAELWIAGPESRPDPCAHDEAAREVA